MNHIQDKMMTNIIQDQTGITKLARVCVEAVGVTRVVKLLPEMDFKRFRSQTKLVRTNIPSIVELEINESCVILFKFNMKTLVR
jgi:hypothetical protein